MILKKLATKPMHIIHMTDILNNNCGERACMKNKLGGEFESENIRGIFKKIHERSFFLYSYRK